MQYAVTFTLTEDYVGPLEYYFFGDDDMWVFLDRQLVCDIGGVHSSVGEYVNLWNYIGADRTEDEQHTLTFFYTEHGASGSTCYMNFTLPSVSGVTLKQTTGNLSVGKEVVGESDPTKDFTFQATFGSNSAFAYYRFDANGIRIDTDKDLTLSSGQTFTLKAGEHIEFQNLPIGMQYSFEETDYSGYSVTNTVNGVVSAGANATGVLIKDMRAGRIRSSPGRCITSRWHRIRTSLSDKTRLWARMTHSCRKKQTATHRRCMSSGKQTARTVSGAKKTNGIWIWTLPTWKTDIWCTSTSAKTAMMIRRTRTRNGI